MNVTLTKTPKNAKGGVFRPGQSYFDLIERFPLVGIRNEAE